MNVNEFIKTVVEESQGFEIGRYLGVRETIIGVDCVKVQNGNEDRFIPACLHPDLSFPEKDDDVLILAGKMIGKSVEQRIVPHIPPVKWSDVIGLDAEVAEIKESISNMDEDIQGILLWGEPGVGKTLIAKAVAYQILGDVDAKFFFYLKGGSILSKYVGVSEGHITKMFAEARTLYREEGKRPIIFIDEADVILTHRGRVNYIDSIVATFLSEMDGFEDLNPLVILATNHPDALDGAITRPGRMDLHLEIKRPSVTGFCNQLEFYGIPSELCDKCTEMISKPLSGALAKSIARFARQKSKGEKIQLNHIKKAVKVC